MELSIQNMRSIALPRNVLKILKHIKKNRSEILSATAKLENPDLCSRYDSSRILFLKFSTFLEGDDDGDDGDGGRILGQGQARYSNAPRD